MAEPAAPLRFSVLNAIPAHYECERSASFQRFEEGQEQGGAQVDQEDAVDPTESNASDPLGLLLPLLLIDSRAIAGLAPIPKELVSIIFDYAHNVTRRWELQWRKSSMHEARGQVQSFDKLAPVLRIMAQNMPKVDKSNLRKWQQKIVDDCFGPFHGDFELPGWDQLIEHQVMGNEYLFDQFFAPPLIDSQRLAQIEARGRVGVPIDRVALYSRLRDRLQAGHLRATRALVTLLGSANSRLFGHRAHSLHFFTVRSLTSATYGDWSMNKVEEYFRNPSAFE